MSTKPSAYRFAGPVVPQIVRWGPSDAQPAGIRIWTTDHSERQFISWPNLKAELEDRLLPQLFASPYGYTFETRNYHGKKEWLVQIFDRDGNSHCDVWFGGNPENGWEFDGLIRVGDANETPHVWQVYQRYSDATYRQLFSLHEVIDSVKRKQPAPGTQFPPSSTRVAV